MTMVIIYAEEVFKRHINGEPNYQILVNASPCQVASLINETHPELKMTMSTVGNDASYQFDMENGLIRFYVQRARAMSITTFKTQELE